MRSTGKLRFARGTHEDLIYLPRPPARSTRTNCWSGQIAMIIKTLCASLSQQFGRSARVLNGLENEN
jgi:hypothetical protein